MRLIKSQWGSGLLGVLTIAALLSTLLPLHAKAQRIDARPAERKAPDRTQDGGQIEAAAEEVTEPGTPAGFEIDGTQQCGDAASLGFNPALPNGDDWGKANGGTCDGEAQPDDGVVTEQFTDCNWGKGRDLDGDGPLLAGDRGDSTQFGSAGVDDGSNTNFDLIGCTAGEHPWEWNGIGGNPQKDDITNVFIHRRWACENSSVECDPDVPDDCGDGIVCEAWLFLGLSTRATNGDRHADFEINQRGLFLVPAGEACDPANGTQVSCGHGEACCDGSDESGRIIGAGPFGGREIGDLLCTMDYEQGGGVPILSVRSWTNDATVCANQDGNLTAPCYADVTGLAGGVNVFAFVNQDDEDISWAPWTGFNSHGSGTNTEEEFQFLEVGINQTDLDIEFPDACLPDATVMAKTRSSQSVTAELKDFALFQFPTVAPPTCEAEGDEVCEGFDATLRAKGAGGKPPYTITWRDGSDSVVHTCNNVAEGVWCNLPFTPATLADAGTYSATVADRRGCVDNPCPVDLIVNPEPTACAGADDECLETGGPLQLGCSPTATGGTPGYTYLWEGAAAGCLSSTSDANPTLDKDCAGVGTHNLCVTVTDTEGCTDQDCGDFTVHPEPTAEAGADDECLETGGPLQLGGSPTATGGTPGYTYLWEGDAANCLSSTSVANPTLDKACAGVGTHNLCVTVTDSEGCTDQDCGDFTVHPEPTACAGSDEDCLEPGGPLQAGCSPTASGGTPGYTYLWEGDAANCLSSTTDANPTLDKSCAGVGTHNLCVTVTDAEGCTDQDCSNFTVWENPSTSPKAGNECLDGPDISVSANASGGSGVYSCVWTGSGAACLADANACSTTLDPDHASCGVGTWTLNVEVTDSNDCTGSGSTSATVYALPICTDTGCDIETPQDLAGGTDGTILCSGMASGEPATSCTESLKAGTGSGWNLTGCSVSGSDVRVTYNIPDPSTASNTASFDITLTTADNCTDVCQGDVGITVECLVEPADPICLDDSRTLKSRVTAGANGQTIAWYGPFEDGDDGAVDGVVDCTAVTLGAAIKTCSNLDRDTDGICDPNVDCCELTVTPSSDGEFSWCALDTEPNGFTSFCRGDLLVNPNPVADAGDDISECFDDFTSDPQVGGSPTASGGTPGYTYEWTGDRTDCLSSTTEANPTFDVSCAGPGSYDLCVRVTDSEGCWDEDCMVLTVYPEPTADAGDDITDCFDDFTSDPEVGGSPTASGGTPGYTYEWTGDRTDCLSSTATANPTFDVSCAGAGVYDLCVRVTDSNGCWDEDCMVLTVYPEPTADAGNDINDCLDDFTSDPQVGGSPTASGGTPGYTYEWTGDRTDCLSSTATANPTFDVSCAGPGSYELCVRVTDSNGCWDEDCMDLEVYPEPNCTVDPPSAEICSTETQQFCAVPAGGTPGYSYLWSTGSTDPCITVSDAGTYTVTVTDSNGCEHDCQGELTVIPCGQACSPGFWRNNLEEWCLTPFIPFAGHCGGSAPTLFKDAFSLASCPGDPGNTALSGNFNTLTLHTAVDSSGGNNQTLFHCSAALLSSTVMGFPLETSQVVDAVQDACSGAISWTTAFEICRDANAVEFDPNGCCPFSDPDCPLPADTTLGTRSEPVRTLQEKSSGR